MRNLADQQLRRIRGQAWTYPSRHTLQQVADELSQAGYRPHRGRAFHLTTGQRLLLPAQREQESEKEGA